GPFLYRNTLALPRAALFDHALLQVDGSKEQRVKLLCSDLWRPHEMLLITSTNQELSKVRQEVLRHFALALFDPRHDPDPEVDASLAAAEVPRFALDALDGPGPADVREAIDKLWEPLQPLPDPPREWNAMHVALPADAGGRWLMLAETFASYPGWSAKVDGAPAQLWNANGIATAILLPQGAREVTLRYVPPGFWLGMTGSAAGLILCAALL